MQDPDPTRPAGRRAEDVASEETRAPASARWPHQIAGFRILGRLGQGGMGTVYLAEQSEPLRRQVALKVIRESRENRDGDFARRFEFERQALAELSHPNIAQILEAGTAEDGARWYALELVDGPPLTEYCARRPLRRRLELFVEVCRAIHFAHSRGILHRDLKPSNILVREVLGRAVPKIIDFGLAKSLGERFPEKGEDTAGIVGTPAYMSPEALEPGLAPGGLDARTDVYALGVLLHELIHGARPTPAQHLRADPGLDRIMAEALAPARGERTPSAAALAGALEDWLGGRRPGRTRAFWAVIVVAIAAVGIALHFNRADAPMRSVAVLPFADLSPGADQRYLAEGVAEALLLDLAQLRELRVISRTSAASLSSGKEPAHEAARRVGIEALVEGAVVRSGPTVQVTVRLIDLRTDAVRWSGRFTREFDELLTLESEVARAIGQALRGELSAADRSRLEPEPQVVPSAALEAYWRGRALWNERTVAATRAALEQFEQATMLAPLWAPGHVGLADAYLLLPTYGGIPNSVAYPRALAAARRALELDPESAEAHATLGIVLLEYSWDWTGAEQAYRRALELNPGYATGHQWYGELLSRAGRHQEALDQLARAEDLDPLSKIVGAVHGWALINARQWDAAEKKLEALLDLDPEFVPAIGFRALVDLGRGRPEKAIPALESVIAGHPDDFRRQAELGIAYARAGRPAEAEAILASLEARAEEAVVPAFHRARLELALGRKVAALESLERARLEGGVWMLFLGVDPLLDDLRDEPRFAALKRAVGFS